MLDIAKQDFETAYKCIQIIKGKEKPSEGETENLKTDVETKKWTCKS